MVKEEIFLDLLGMLDDKYVTPPLEDALAKQIEQETSDFKREDNQSEQNNKV